MGNSIEQTLRGLLRELRGLHLTRLPRGFVVEAIEAPGPLMEAVYRAVIELEARVEEAFPVLHVEMGPVWTGTLQAVFPTTLSRAPVTPTPAATTTALVAVPPTPVGPPGAA